MIVIFKHVLFTVIYVFDDSISSHYKPFRVNTNSYVLVRILVILEMLILSNIVWSSVLLTSFMISMVSIVLTKELDKCIDDPQEKILKDKFLSNDTFSDTAEIFYELICLVKKVDEMFSVVIGLNLALSFGMLCAATYGIFVGDGKFKNWTVPILISVLTLLILLPSISNINTKVREKVRTKCITVHTKHFMRISLIDVSLLNFVTFRDIV